MTTYITEKEKNKNNLTATEQNMWPKHHLTYVIYLTDQHTFVVFTFI